ncbi:MAG: ATP-dependent RecD-like DNA helicase [Bacteroidales bacterium]
MRTPKESALESAILKVFEHAPTTDQEKAIEQICAFVYSGKNDELLILSGYAGTGKTSIVGALVKALVSVNHKSMLLAPTGRAAKVLAGYSKKAAYTIHKKIYRQKSSSDLDSKFVLDKNLHTNTIFIVDEASMINSSNYEDSLFGSGSVLNDLLYYVSTGVNCKLLFVGDSAQLPPVGQEMSAALDMKALSITGFTPQMSVLAEVVRQSLESGILYNATTLRQVVNNESMSFLYAQLKLEGFSDIVRIGGGELIEEISSCYDAFGLEETMIITRSNKRAIRFNQGIRNTVLYQENEICVGDMIIVVKNNYYWSEGFDIEFIANGDIAKIIRIKNYEEMHGYRFANVSLEFCDYNNIEIDCKIILDTISMETPALNREQNKALYLSVAADYEYVANKAKRWRAIKSDKYFNALQVKHAYALTCHKAQGGQWKACFIDQGYLVEEMLNKEYYRWLYTAFTRAQEKLYLVNFNKEFFEDEL